MQIKRKPNRNPRLHIATAGGGEWLVVTTEDGTARQEMARVKATTTRWIKCESSYYYGPREVWVKADTITAMWVSE